MAHAPHAHRPFEGAFGLVAGLAMTAGRGALARMVNDVAGIGPGDCVLDVGCGPGAIAREAARRGATVTGVDPSSLMLRMAQRLTKDDVRARVEYLAGTAEHLPVQNGSATVALAVASAHHWTDIAAGLIELHRVIAPGGRLVIVEGHGTGRGWLAHHALTPDGARELADKVANAGFEAVTTDTHAARRKRFIAIQARRPA